MAKPLVRLRFVEVGVGLALLALVLRAGQVQLIKGRSRYAEALRNARSASCSTRAAAPCTIGMAPRSRSRRRPYHVGVAPNELPIRAATSPRSRASCVSRHGTSSAPCSAGTRRLPARSPQDVQPIRAMRGVHLEPVLRRFYPSQEFARAIISGSGMTAGDPAGVRRTLGGCSTTSGRHAGAAVVLKDREGRSMNRRRASSGAGRQQ